MRQLGRLEARFMLREIDNQDIDIDLLQALNVRMLSLTANFINHEIASADGFQRAISLRRSLESNGFRVIIDGINNEMMLRDFNDLAPRYAAGALFSESEARAKTNQPVIYQ